MHTYIRTRIDGCAYESASVCEIYDSTWQIEISQQRFGRKVTLCGLGRPVKSPQNLAKFEFYFMPNVVNG